MTIKQDHSECDCIFCNSKCPECDSTDVRVQFKLGFSYENDTEDSISLSREPGEIELICEECDTWIISNFNEGRLDKLLSILSQAIDPPSELSANIGENGKIEYVKKRFKTVDRPIE